MYHLMIVEPDLDLQAYYRTLSIWENCGFTLKYMVTTTQKALALIKLEPVDLLITDIDFPFMNGFDLLSHLKTHFQGLPVALNSTRTDFEYVQQGFRLGAVDYLAKPLTEQALTDCLNKIRVELDVRKPHAIIPSCSTLFSHITGCSFSDQEPLVQKACLYLEKHLLSFPTMQDVADALSLNKDYFGKRFKQRTGIPFTYYSKCLKLEYAKILLTHHSHKIYEISELLGYGSANYFSKLFKDYTRVTPQQYRDLI